MVETHRRFVLLINLKAQPGVVLFDFIQQRPANALADGVRRDKQRADDRKADADRLERIETDIRAMRDVMFEAFQRGRTD